EVDLEGGAAGALEAPGRQTADVEIEGHVPPVVQRRHGRHPDLADDLRPQVKRVLRLLPARKRELGQSGGCGEAHGFCCTRIIPSCFSSSRITSIRTSCEARSISPRRSQRARIRSATSARRSLRTSTTTRSSIGPRGTPSISAAASAEDWPSGKKPSAT